MDDLTHTVTVTITGNYPHGGKQHAKVEMSGAGDLDFMIDVFQAALVSAGFTAETAGKLGMLEGQ